MNRNEEITKNAEEILLDITENRKPLHIVLLKCSRLALLLDLPQSVSNYKGWAVYAESNLFTVDTFRDNIEAAKDSDVSVSSANPNERVTGLFGLGFSHGNVGERHGLRQNASQVIGFMANYRSNAYNFALNVYTKSQFGNLAENIFEKKRTKAEPIIREKFPDINQRLNSIEQNLRSENSEGWKSAVSSCRTLMMDVADILVPPKSPEEKGQFINRLKTFVSPIKSKTKKKLLNNYLDELKNRIEYTMDLTQGSSHQARPLKDEAEDVVLYTYLIISDLFDIYGQRNKTTESLPEKQVLPETTSPE